jgi:hypothetical protein
MPVPEEITVSATKASRFARARSGGFTRNRAAKASLASRTPFRRSAVMPRVASCSVSLWVCMDIGELSRVCPSAEGGRLPSILLGA